MIRDNGRQQRRSIGDGGAAPRARGRHASPAVEALEGRRLLSFYTGPTASRPLFSGGTFFTSSVAGGGFETVHRMKHGQVGIDLIGTNPGSTLTITAQTNRARFQNAPLKIGEIKVETGLLGGINASAADLLGPMTPLAGSVSSIKFNSIAKNGRIDVEGSVGAFSVPVVNLGAGGAVRIAGDLTGNLGGSLVVDGGVFDIGGNVSGAFAPGGLVVEHGGLVSVGHDVTAGMQIAGSILVNTNGLVVIGKNLHGLTVGQSLNLSTGGRFLVGGDVTGPVTVADGLTITGNGMLAVGRDVKSLDVTGDLSLGSGGRFAIGRGLTSLVVNGNLSIGQGGQISVGGSIATLTVNGALQGQGSPANIDLVVGLNLSNLTVLGGGADQGGIQNANIDVGKNLTGLDVRHGIFNSLITAGVLIDGTTNSTLGGAGTVGADGPDAVFDSEIRAGVQIKNITFDGNVRSDYVTNPNPTGYRTRIIAGENRAGVYSSGGNIDNFQITGALMDSVLAASVAPYGGNGTMPATAYGAPPPSVGNPPGDGGSNTYDAPAGVIVGGTVSNPKAYNNYSEASYNNETFTNIAYNTAIDPTIDDAILPGAINQSFASTPLTQAQLNSGTVTITSTSGSSSSSISSQNNNSTTTTQTVNLKIPLPSKSTVLGGVISTPHGDAQDFAGIFAADTRGVFVGLIPN